MTTYYATVVTGLETVAWGEIREHLPNARLLASSHGKMTIDYAGQPEDFFELRSIENVYIAVATIPHIGFRREALRALEETMATLSLEEALTALRRVQQTHPELSSGRQRRGKLGLRVTSTMVGERSYRRLDAQIAVEKGLLQRFKGQWELEVKDPDIEIMLDLQPEEALISVRLSGGLLRRREYKQAHIPASLKPTVAYAMVRMSQPEDTDVFLDPMCGAGTILLERAYAGRYEMLYGGDNDPKAVAATLENLGSRHKPWQVEQWDARHLPLSDGSVDKVVCNLPFGKQIGTLAENEHLYRAVLAEIERVLRPGGLTVLLTSRWQLIADLLRRNPIFAPVSPAGTGGNQSRAHNRRSRGAEMLTFDEIPSTSIDLLGERAYIFVFEHTGGERRQAAPRGLRRSSFYQEMDYIMEEDTQRPAEAPANTEGEPAIQAEQAAPPKRSGLLQRALSRRGMVTATREEIVDIEEATPAPPAEPPRRTEPAAERPRRNFDDRPQLRGFDDRPPRRDNDDRPPRRDFTDRPQRRDFDDRPPRRDFDDRRSGDRPANRYNENQGRGARRFDDDRPPRRDFADRPQRRFDDDRGSRTDTDDRDQRPRRVVDRTAEDRRARQEEFERRSRTPRRDFGDRPPRREFNDRPQGRDFGDRPPRRDNDDRPPRRDYDDRPPRREYNDRPTGSSRSGGYRSDRPGATQGRSRYDDRAPRNDRPSGGYRDRDGGSGRPPRRFDDDRPPRGPRPGGPPRRRS